MSSPQSLSIPPQPIDLDGIIGGGDFSSDDESIEELGNRSCDLGSSRVLVTIMSFGFKFGPPESLHKVFNLRRCDTSAEAALSARLPETPTRYFWW